MRITKTSRVLTAAVLTTVASATVVTFARGDDSAPELSAIAAVPSASGDTSARVIEAAPSTRTELTDTPEFTSPSRALDRQSGQPTKAPTTEPASHTQPTPESPSTTPSTKPTTSAPTSSPSPSAPTTSSPQPSPTPKPSPTPTKKNLWEQLVENFS